MRDRPPKRLSSSDRTDPVVERVPSPTRRSLLSALGATGAAVSLAGCIGGDETRMADDTEDDPEGEPVDGDDDSGDDSADEDAETDAADDAEGDESVDRPAFVVESDPLYGRTEVRPSKGVVVVDIRPDHLPDDAEPSEVAIVETATGDAIVEDGAYSSDTLEVPINSWAGPRWHRNVATEIEIQVRNDFGDVLAATTWDLTPDVEITDVGVVHEYPDANGRTSGDLHGDVYVEIENRTAVPLALSRVRIPDVYGTTLDIRDEDLASLDETADHALVVEPDAGTPAVAGSGTTRLVSTNAPLVRSTYAGGSPDGFDCGVVYETSLELELAGTDDPVVRPVSVTAGSEQEHDSGGTYDYFWCVETTIDLE